MKLSEAIREGSKHNEQVFGMLVTDFGTCALGAALCGIGKFPVKNENGYWYWDNLHFHGMLQYENWEYYFPILRKVPKVCHLCDYVVKYNGYGMISHFNDKHHWTREAIAMWVETIENEIESQEAAGDHLDGAHNEKDAEVQALPVPV